MSLIHWTHPEAPLTPACGAQVPARELTMHKELLQRDWTTNPTEITCGDCLHHLADWSIGRLAQIQCPHVWKAGGCERCGLPEVARELAAAGEAGGIFAIDNEVAAAPHLSGCVLFGTVR
jgi:hypothetical protein